MHMHPGQLMGQLFLHTHPTARINHTPKTLLHTWVRGWGIGLESPKEFRGWQKYELHKGRTISLWLRAHLKMFVNDAKENCRSLESRKVARNSLIVFHKIVVMGLERPALKMTLQALTKNPKYTRGTGKAEGHACGGGDLQCAHPDI